MERRRKEEDDIAVATGQRPMPDQDIMEEVLGHRSSYRRGFGYGMPIDQHRIDYYEQPRDEDFVHSEYDRTAQQQHMNSMEERINFLMSLVPPQTMSSCGQYPPYQQAAPHMGHHGSGSGSSQPSFTPFTPVPPPPHPYQGFHGTSSQPSMFTHVPRDPSLGSAGPSGQQRGQHPSSGVAHIQGGGGFGQFSSQAPAFGSYAFPGATPVVVPGSSMPHPHTPTRSVAAHSTPASSPASSSPAAVSQRMSIRGSGRARQRQQQRH